MIALAPGWAAKGYGLRRARARDRDFQRELFGLCRLDAPLLAQWPAEERKAFLDSQFALQDRHYRRYFEGADFSIVTHNGMRIGRLILYRTGTHWQLVDIGLMPDARGQGLGEALLHAVQAACLESGGETVGLQVEFGNRARTLYNRLGFVAIEDSGAHTIMEWRGRIQLKTAS
jgi:GNAT superfamily N-acetyltransferase